MLAKGILDEKEAIELRGSLQSRPAEDLPPRSHTMEWIGVLLLGAMILLFWLATGTASAPQAVEDVRQSLNAPVRSGMAGYALLGVVLLLWACVAYVVLYLLARLSYAFLSKRAARLGQLDAEERHLLLMREALEKKAGRSKQEKPSGNRREFILRLDPDENPVDAWRYELETALRRCRDERAKTRSEYLRLRRGLTGALAGLIGPSSIHKEKQ
jgi:hypothetical protein